MPNDFADSRDVGATVEECPYRKKTKPLHWIEVELVGEDDKPIPYVEYLIKLPDAAVVSGYLDRNGFTRVDGIEQAGTCGVCFPELDEEAWTFVQSYAEPAGEKQEEAQATHA